MLWKLLSLILQLEIAFFMTSLTIAMAGMMVLIRIAWLILLRLLRR
ncbi:hypothetical protein [Jiella marina]|nr:hypothetical protein [Jiella sp. LLJ827]MCQ0990550.1 hypothetical protein [Jiella sp. LLJ827]